MVIHHSVVLEEDLPRHYHYFRIRRCCHWYYAHCPRLEPTATPLIPTVTQDTITSIHSRREWDQPPCLVPPLTMENCLCITDSNVIASPVEFGNAHAAIHARIWDGGVLESLATIYPEINPQSTT